MSLNVQRQWKTAAQIFQKERTQVDPLEPPKGGAPAEPRQERRNPVSVRFSESEIQFLKREAKAAGCSFRGYIREQALKSFHKPPINPALKDLLLKVYTELTRQGNNLNQFARHLNAGTATKNEGAAP